MHTAQIDRGPLRTDPAPGNGPQVASAQALIRRLHSLYPLETQEVAEFTAIIKDVQSISGNEHILLGPTSSREALVLLEGLACHCRTMETGRRQMTSFVVPGDFCDYGFLSASPVRQSILSLGRATVGRISLAQLSSLAERNSNIMVAIMRAASVDQACCRELAVNLGARDALTRVAHFVCEMYHRMHIAGLVSRSGQFAMTMTQAEFGEALGLSTVHVNRTVQQLRGKNLIAMAQGRIAVPDIAALEALAVFDGRYLRSS